MVRILINANEQVTQESLGKYLFAGDVKATVESAPKEAIEDLLLNNSYDILAFVAEEGDNDFLEELFEANTVRHKILFLKRHLLESVSQGLEEKLDDIFTLPLSFSDFSIRIRRLVKSKSTAEKEAEDSSQEEETEDVPESPEIEILQSPSTEEDEFDTPPFAEEDSRTEDTVDELEAISEEIEDEKSELEEEDSNSPKLEQEPGFVLQTEVKEPDPAQDEGSSYRADSKVKPGRKGKKKTPLRYLNKTDLLEIILEQEKIINAQRVKAQKIEEELAKREIILEKSGSIADAATKICGIFEAAQDAADRYLESVKATVAEEETQAAED